MKKLRKNIRVIIPTGFFILVWLSTSISLQAALKGPRIEFIETEWDFGNVKQGKVMNHVFKFRNTGDEPLIIKRVRTDCGCTAALVTDKKVAPGKKGEIKVSFNTLGYGGELRKYIYVESNDPVESNKQLVVKADIDIPPRPEIYLNQYTIDLGLNLENEEINAKVKISNQGELELNVFPAHRNATFYINGKEIENPIKIAAAKSVELEIKLMPQRRSGLLREYVLLKSNDPVKSSLSLYMSGYVITKDQLKDLFKKYKDVINN